MGFNSDLDVDGQHEGWVGMVFADRTLSSGTSTAAGYYVEGYTYLPSDPDDPSTWGVIDPSDLRPFSDIAGWVPRCQCGWQGIAHELWPDVDYGDTREPTTEQEYLFIYQWRLHLRDVFGIRSLVSDVSGEVTR